MTDQHEVRNNVAFRGLSEEEALTIQGYQHFRNVQNAVKLKGLLDDEACFNRNFLDEAADADRKDVWSIIKAGARGNVSVLRNQEWPGYSCFHQIGSSMHSEVYIGDGLKDATFEFFN